MIRLVLFFTRGVSLQTWANVGMFDREVALYRKLRQSGLGVSFVTYGNRGDLELAKRIPEIEVLCNKWMLPQKMYEYLLPKLCARTLERCSVVKTNQTNGADVALRAAMAWGKPLIARCGFMLSEFMAREHGEDSRNARAACSYEARIFGAAQRVVVTTPMMAGDVARRLPLVEKKTVLIPNYVQTDIFRPMDDVKRDLDFIFIGRLFDQKNVLALIDAVAPLNLRGLIVGDGKLASHVRRFVDGSNGRIEWLKKVPNAELPRQINRAKFYVLPSHYEGHPKTLIEAMSCGVPVIGADSPGVRELICDGETGFLCGTDAASIRVSLQKALGDPYLRKTIGDNGQRYAFENYSLDTIVRKELSLLEEIVH